MSLSDGLRNNGCPRNQGLVHFSLKEKGKSRTSETISLGGWLEHVYTVNVPEKFKTMTSK